MRGLHLGPLPLTQGRDCGPASEVPFPLPLLSPSWLVGHLQMTGPTSYLHNTAVTEGHGWVA